MDNIRVTPGNPYPLGAYCVDENEVNIAVVCMSDEPAGVILYDRKNGSVKKIP